MTDHEMAQELYRIKDRNPVAFDADRSALVVVDVQRFFARPESAFARTFERLVSESTAAYFERIQSVVVPGIKRLLAAFRGACRPVIYFAVGCHTSDGSDLPGWMRGFDELSLHLNGERVCPPVGDPNGAIDDRVAPQPGEVVLTKSSSGPSASTNLDQVLRNLGVTSLAVCGLTTAVCVAQTARETADRGYNVIVASDACTELSEESHRAALHTFGLIFGRIKTADEIAEFLNGERGITKAKKTAPTTIVEKIGAAT